MRGREGERHAFCYFLDDKSTNVACHLGAMGGITYSLPRSSEFLDEQKMDIVNDSGRSSITVITIITRRALGKHKPRPVLSVFSVVFARWQDNIRHRLALSGRSKEFFSLIKDLFLLLVRYVFNMVKRSI